jgi:hypothetical protein
MLLRFIVVVGLAGLAVPASVRAEQLVFGDVKARFSRSATDRPLVDKEANLTLDDEARTLIVKSERPIQVKYDDVLKVVFDVSTHMRGGALSSLVGGVAGAAIASQHVSDYWCFLEYRGADGTARGYMLEVAQDASAKVIAAMRATFGDRVSVTEFAEKEASVDKRSLKAIDSKHALSIDKKNHPIPEPMADKALVVVVCPPLAARYSGKGVQYKLHANDAVVAVNKMGTYSFAYLDPGDYLLVSQTENASGFRMTLEAGKEYYFLQNTFTGAWKSRTRLSRHSKELVMYEANGAHLSVWKQK